MKPILMIVSDVDGTLVDKQKQLTPATIDAVARLEAAGVPFTIVSARPRSGMMPIAETLAIDRPMGAFNGGTIFTRDGTIIEQHMIDPAVARAMVTLSEGSDVDIWVFADDRWYATSGEGDHVDSERVSSNQEPVIVDDVADLLDRADKITFVSDHEPALRALHERGRQFADKATIVQSQTYYLDITALAANKGDGVAALAAAADIPLDAVAAIGDQANDIPMLERVGLSIAMGNAADAVKSVADQTTLANDRDGVAAAIDTLILPRIGVSA